MGCVMTLVRSVYTLLFTAIITFLSSESVTAFVPAPSPIFSHDETSVRARKQQLSMGVFDGEQERKSLTRESEPDEFFATNTDKMSDEEKLPIALAGLVGISLPFILGLIALYAAQG